MGGSSSHSKFFLENRSTIALIFWGSIPLCILIVHTHGRRSWGDEGMHPPYDRSGGGMACTIIPPYKGDEQMKSILHNTQIITPEEIVSYIDDEIIFSMKFE